MIWDYGLVKPDELPKRWEPWEVKQELFFPFFDALGIPRNHLERTWRPPSWHNEHTRHWTYHEEETTQWDGNPDVSTWHKDGGPEHVVNYFAVWSSRHPTQFLLPDGKVVIPPVKHVTVVDNQNIWHRSGRNVSRRHFVRVTLPDDWTPQEELKWH